MKNYEEFQKLEIEYNVAKRAIARLSESDYTYNKNTFEKDDWQKRMNEAQRKMEWLIKNG
jgi:ADP-dependent phosphofructokinase/glucokinase